MSAVQPFGKESGEARVKDALGRGVNVVFEPHEFVFLGFGVENAERRPGIIVARLPD